MLLPLHFTSVFASQSSVFAFDSHSYSSINVACGSRYTAFIILAANSITLVLRSLNIFTFLYAKKLLSILCFTMLQYFYMQFPRVEITWYSSRTDGTGYNHLQSCTPEKPP